MHIYHKGNRLDINDGDRQAPEWLDQVRETFLNHKREKPLSIRTSGSTGTPKLITHSYDSAVRSAQLTIDRFGLSRGTRAWLCLPAQYIAGSMMIMRAIVGDWELHVSRPSANPITELDAVVDFAAMTPMQLQLGLETHPERVETINQIILGGGPISPSLEQRIKTMSNKIYHTYGMTETITHVAIRPVNDQGASGEFEGLTGVTFSTQYGCLVIHADHLDQSQIETLDLVELTSSTSFTWQGRANATINSGGLKIQPEEVEKELGVIDGVNYVVMGESDELLGHRCILICDAADDDVCRVKNALQRLSDPKKRPRKIYRTHQIILTETGKPRRDISLYDDLIQVNLS